MIYNQLELEAQSMSLGSEYHELYDTNDIELDNFYQFYGESYGLLERVIMEMLSRLDVIRQCKMVHSDMAPIAHCKARIKTVESMKEKLKRRGFAITKENALESIYDAAGIRVVCNFIDDIYLVVNLLKNQLDLEVMEEKDYIKNPKKNGYRSYHMNLRVPLIEKDKVEQVYCELQIRTIAMDCWASLEHRIKYKKNISNQELIIQELKRCADEIASTDLNFQTICDMIKEAKTEEVTEYENSIG